MNKDIKLLKWMFSFTKNCRLMWIIARISNIVVDFFLIFFEASAFKNLFLCFSERDAKYLVLSVLFYVIKMIISALGQGFTAYATTFSNGKFNGNVKESMINKVLKLPLYNLGEHTGETLAILNQDVDLSCEALNNAVDNVLLPGIKALCFLAVTYFVSWQMGLFYTISLIPIIIVNLFFNNKFHDLGLKIQESLSTMNGRFQDSLVGARFIKSFMLENTISSELQESAENVLKAQKDEQNLKFKYMWIANIFLHSFVTFPILIGCYLVSKGDMILADVMFVSRYTYAIRYLAIALIKSATEIPRQSSGIERIYDIFHRKDEKIEFGKLKSVNKEGAILSLHNISVSFRDKNVVDNFSLDVKENQSIALVGSSGAGKSTIIKAIMGFVQYDGDIKLYGKSFKEYDLEYLRSLISYVPQESVLFNSSIYENILYGNPKASKEEVIKAAKLAFAHDFIMDFTDGYETLVGENGANLSGGQKQRICIARAFLKNSPILLLDEATSALDLESEGKIQKAINNLMIGKTIIVIAHRLSTIVNSDEIIVINDGKIAERGNHAELLDKNGIYNRMYELQK